VRLAIIGSRDFPDRARVVRYVGQLSQETVVVSGKAPGVDRWAAEVARRRNMTVEELPADWDRLGRRAGFERNEALVAKVDAVVAFWTTKSRGTAHAILVALRKNKPIRVCGPRGEEIPKDRLRDMARRVLDAKAPPKPDDVNYDPAWEKDVVSTHRTAMLRRWGRARVR